MSTSVYRKKKLFCKHVCWFCVEERPMSARSLVIFFTECGSTPGKLIWTSINAFYKLHEQVSNAGCIQRTCGCLRTRLESSPQTCALWCTTTELEAQGFWVGSWVRDDPNPTRGTLFLHGEMDFFRKLGSPLSVLGYLVTFCGVDHAIKKAWECAQFIQMLAKLGRTKQTWNHGEPTKAPGGPC